MRHFIATLKVYHKNGNSTKQNTINICKLISEDVKPVVVALNSDASLLVLALLNGNQILLLPTEYLIVMLLSF